MFLNVSENFLKITKKTFPSKNPLFSANLFLIFVKTFEKQISHIFENIPLNLKNIKNFRYFLKIS